MIDGFQQHEKLRFLYVLDATYFFTSIYIQYFPIIELVGNYIYIYDHLPS